MDMDMDEVVVAAGAVEAKMDEGVEVDEAEVARAAAVPDFPALSARQMQGSHAQFLRVPIPPHRLAPLQKSWMEVYQPVVEHMKLQIRFNPKRRAVELRTSQFTENGVALQKAADFIRAFALGFEMRDAIALLRLDDLYVDSFEVKDVRALQGEHLSRAIGRVAGVGGKTKYAIENATRTRIVLADSHVHILGSFTNIKIAKDAIVRLILGSPPGKVYNQMRAVANRMKDRF
jgi:RNA-binding protein PNO1